MRGAGNNIPHRLNQAKASDPRFPSYLFETKGEIVDVKGDYALIKFGKVPTPNVWLRVDQLEEFK
ncbi:MAG: NAD(P)H-quinone oxidoreductase subunit O [Nostoc sp. JL31]|nr:NAD(P)H-quinone oxidoreductase subunit O [Nostoc sp. JL31]